MSYNYYDFSRAMMINIYAYTYPKATNAIDGYIITKVGDSHRDPKVRMSEQGGAAEWESKIPIGVWNDLKNIRRDHDVHAVLSQKGLWYKGGAGNEWFKIPGTTPAEAFAFLDNVITVLEEGKVRPPLQLRKAQDRTLDKAMEIITTCNGEASIIANLAPRFGKTVWALSLFNRINKEYGNRVMLLPAYWLSVHTSFDSELGAFADFVDIDKISVDSDLAEADAHAALTAGRRIVVPISLHGDYDTWCRKHRWISKIPNDDIFMFADEGDFGTHTENQVEKLNFLFASV